MYNAVQNHSRIRLHGQRKLQLAQALQQAHPAVPKPSSTSNPIRVVCISDTHNKQPALPPGDILIHAGDLTENGSFNEVQAGLDWLSSQAHQHKILIAGNHDILFDEAFLAKFPERRHGRKCKEHLNWGSVIYLQDSSITLEFPPPSTSQEAQPRTLTIFGSPWSPQYGVSAFQYRLDDVNHWSSRFASLHHSKPDILVTHSPPRHHLDARGFYRAGCPYLAEEVASLCPRLVVFGHIHASYGREDVVMDGVQRSYELIMTGWAGWGRLVWMTALVAWARLKRLCRVESSTAKTTTFVNAAVVGVPKNELKNDAITVKM